MSAATAKGRAAVLPAGVDVLVIGGGIAGLVAAWRAAVAGAETLIVEDRAARPPAASVAAGMLAPVGEASWGEERLLAAELWAAEAWPAFADELAEAAQRELPYRRCGGLYVALDRDEATELRRLHELHRRLGLGAELLRPSRARELEPGLTSSLTAAVHAPGEAEVDPRALLEALAAGAAGRGARSFAGRVCSLAEAGDSGTLVTLEDGRSLAAGRVVVAAGAWSGTVEGLPPLPIRPVKGEILRLAADPGMLPCERIVRGERFYLVPRENGEVVVGATAEERGFDRAVTAGAVHELLREAYRAVPELAELRFVEAAAGLRPGTPDNAPILGPIGQDGPIVLTGLFRNGILLAPLVAALADACLGTGEPPQAAAGLGPDRFGAATAPDVEGARA
jgi:glycine oxidase